PDRAIGVIFSGYDGDGSAGCEHIKEKGGIIFAQDQSAEVDSMPVSAQASGCVDFFLAPDKIAAALIEIGARFARRPQRHALRSD
ncbi:MAG: chemotaxis protein CheB, partial [Rhodoferax sp.]|nr:chemotaxis protein CheB [Rhodoferax sp.]